MTTSLEIVSETLAKQLLSNKLIISNEIILKHEMMKKMLIDYLTYNK